MLFRSNQTYPTKTQPKDHQTSVAKACTPTPPHLPSCVSYIEPYRGDTSVAAGVNPRTTTHSYLTPVGGATYQTQSPKPKLKNPTHPDNPDNPANPDAKPKKTQNAAPPWHWKILASIPKPNKIVGCCIGDEASHCLSVASFGLRANAAAHGHAKIIHSLDLFGYFLHQGKK